LDFNLENVKERIRGRKTYGNNCKINGLPAGGATVVDSANASRLKIFQPISDLSTTNRKGERGSETTQGQMALK